MKRGKHSRPSTTLRRLGYVFSPVTAYLIAMGVGSHERQLGLYCPQSACGPDDLPTAIFLGSWFLLALAVHLMTKED